MFFRIKNRSGKTVSPYNIAEHFINNKHVCLSNDYKAINNSIRLIFQQAFNSKAWVINIQYKRLFRTVQ